MLTGTDARVAGAMTCAPDAGPPSRLMAGMKLLVRAAQVKAERGTRYFVVLLRALRVFSYVAGAFARP
jgi:hypothetical protein